MKRAKILSLFLAGCLLFQTAGIDAMATAPSEPAPVSETVEDADKGLSEQPSEEESESKESTEEEEDSEQPSEGEEKGKDPAGEDDSEQSSEGGSEEKDAEGEESDPEQPSDEEDENTPSDEEDGEIKDSVSENTVLENTISENTLPEDEASIFSIFPGLGDNYKFSPQQLADKRVLSSHVEDVVQIHSLETATISDFRDASDKYELGEVVYLSETKEEAEQVAKAFGGTLESYSYEVAVISLPEKATVALAIAAAAEPDIKLPAVWPNYYQYLHTDTNVTVDSLTISDPGFTDQWQHDYIGTRYAWAAGFKGKDIKVAVIDTGLNQNHEDLKNNALAGKTFVDDENGTPQATDNQTHGTHVAGIIAADDNTKGGRGIAPDANVRGYSVFSADNRCKTSWIERAVNAAVNDGNHIINMSLGSPNYDGNYEKVFKNAYEKGVAIFASSGNDDSDGYNFPAAYASTISVGAVDQNGTRASFSNYGKTVTLSFPGVKIYSTLPASNNSYGYMSGTSQASPAAAGTAAVILSARKDIRDKTGKARVDALLSAMKSSTTKCASSGMGAGTTYLPGVLKIATDMTVPDAPVITVAGNPVDKAQKTYKAERLNVTLTAPTAVGVKIYYTTDGKAPTYRNGAITVGSEYTGSFSVGDAKNITIKAIAVNPITGKVSKVASKAVILTPIPRSVTVAPVDNVTKIAAGKTLKFTATVELPYAISNKVQWTVVDEYNKEAKSKGVTVSNGTVKTTATKTLTTPAGKYKVIATAVGNDGKTFDGKTGTYTFTVIESATIKKVAFLDVDGKPLKPQTLDTEYQQTFPIRKCLTVTKTDAKTKKDTVLSDYDAVKEIVWSSSNPSVATVVNNEITAVAPGKAVIKAISNDGGNKSASCTVTVVQPVTKITLSGPNKVAAGKGITLTAEIEPANATNKKLDWKVTTGNDKATVAATGKVTAKKNATGTFKVTATAKDGYGTSSAAYTVTIVSGEIKTISLDKKTMTLFVPATGSTAAKTGTLKKTVTVTGSGADTSLVQWSSSAPHIADVDPNGKVTAKSAGKATITCASTDGSNKKATCTVTVAVPMSKLVIGPTDGNDGVIAVSKKVKMAAKYYSNYGTPTNTKIDWKIVKYNNVTAKQVSIDKNGTVSVTKDAAPGGSVIVQATAQDGSGVSSNTYPLAIWPNFIAAELVLVATTYDSKRNLVLATKDTSIKNINGYYFMVQATDAKDSKGKPDWSEAMLLPDFYCTATVSGPKNIGLYKTYLTSSSNVSYALYGPQPLKYTSKQLDYSWVSLYKNECDNITLTVTLKDGSNLKAKVSTYAVGYKNTGGYNVIGYY